MVHQRDHIYSRCCMERRGQGVRKKNKKKKRRSRRRERRKKVPLMSDELIMNN